MLLPAITSFYSCLGPERHSTLVSTRPECGEGFASAAPCSAVRCAAGLTAPRPAKGGPALPLERAAVPPMPFDVEQIYKSGGGCVALRC